MKKTNQELNREHDARQQARVRPKAKEYNWEPLQAVIEQWRRKSHDEQAGILR